jgi:hypothetical protein
MNPRARLGNAEKIASEPADVGVNTPDGRDVSVTFYLGSLR